MSFSSVHPRLEPALELESCLRFSRPLHGLSGLLTSEVLCEPGGVRRIGTQPSTRTTLRLLESQ